MNHQQIAFTLLLALTLASPAQATVDDARAKGIKWLVQTQKGDGSFVGLQGPGRGHTCDRGSSNNRKARLESC